MLIFLLACTTDGPAYIRDTSDTAACFEGAVGPLCIDAVETTVIGDVGNADQGQAWPDGSTDAVSTAQIGAEPSAHLSWYQAAAVCQNRGRHLCTVSEWQQACGDAAFPWGDSPEAVDVCVVAAADGTTTWSSSQPAGSAPDCRTEDGVFDQMGNLWEWADPEQVASDGTPITAKLGGAWYAGGGDARCHLEPNTQHAPGFDGDIGFRCCG